MSSVTTVVGPGPQDAAGEGSSSEETSLQSNTAKSVAPSSKYAPKSVQDPASESSSQAQAERILQQPATAHLSEKALTWPSKDNLGLLDAESLWLRGNDRPPADKVQKKRTSSGGVRLTKISRHLVRPTTIGGLNQNIEAKDRYGIVRREPIKRETEKLSAAALKTRSKVRGSPETRGPIIAKQKDARDDALKKLNFGTDTNWPDESQVLDQIWRQQDKVETTQLEWQIDKQKELGIPGSEKSVKQCVVSIEVDKDHKECNFSNTEGVICLNIISGPLQEVLRQVIAFDPTVSLYKDPIVFVLPFTVLFHNMAGLEDYSQRADADESGARDLRVLLYICKKLFARLFQSIRLCLAAGDVFNEALSALYRPGTLLLSTDIYEQPHVFMCLSARLECVQTTDGRVTEFIVRAWYMQWNHLYQRLERRIAHFTLGNHVGTRKIKELSVYPFDYYGTAAAQEDLKGQIIERNRQWARTVRRKASCWMHKGLVKQLSNVAIIKHHGRVVVEEDQSLVAAWLFTDVHGFSAGHVRYWDSRPEYLSWEKLGIDAELTKDQLLLCTSAIWCYDLLEQKSMLVSSSDLQPVDWNKSAINHLVLDQDMKDLLCGVVKNHSKDSPSQTQDIIEGKGSGLVIVLHGPPGVGKTLTAECVAEYMEKPLIALRISDLVTNESTFTNSVTERLQDADKLGAIILLDEADVILESRSFEDVKRNGIVSAFLRTLEYFNGIIIMTTNRIQTMDVAFQSRIQVAIEYKHLNTGSRRKIWGMFIKKLENADAREEMLDEMEYLKKSNLNGRQIRSVMKVSESLAKSDGREHMSVAHVKRAVETASLQKYFEGRKEISRGNLRVTLQGAGQDSRRRDEDDED